ncbi:MAG: DUF1343 domain-containing protein [Dysgonamonadaceae bacterium]|jgi:uncharacterized protein YbbC (DUF1343 family)|nr:DUF1343 domain-containing protein [Dysgonamonadaceae bacterium]
MKRIWILCLGFWILQANLPAQSNSPVIVGAELFAEYFPLLKDKKIGVFTNHTGRVGEEHLVDMLQRSGFDLRVIFAPEHGFRGTADAGEHISDSMDIQTRIPIHSLFNLNGKKSGLAIVSQLDVVLVDIQDVGLRFYTYYISMYQLMDACAKYHKQMIILDRPNPNGFYVDGPLLDMKYKSGVGCLPIPVVHGMTLGELAQMINGEKWLPEGKTCLLQVIYCKNYTHQTKYQLPVPPSPNLPNMKAVYLYPSLCLFEGTKVSVGRGTAFPFQVYGCPQMQNHSFSFVPKSVPGAKFPPFKNQTCKGTDLRAIADDSIFQAGINLEYLIDAYRNTPAVRPFFNSFFENLIGVDYVRKMIVAGRSAEEIRAMWQADVENFKIQRRPYLLYESEVTF